MTPDGRRSERNGANASLRSPHVGEARAVAEAAWPPPSSGSRIGAPLALLEGWSSVAVHALVLALILATGHLDSLSDAYTVFPLYVVPVSLAAWRLGREAGLGWALAAAAVAFLASAVSGSPPPPVSFWDVASQLVVLAMAAVAVARIRSLTGLARTLAGTDHLTGLLDGHGFQELVELERSRALRYNRPFTLAYLDVDRLQAINDLRGHTTGDRTLQLISRTICENLRSMDSVARLAGDEFGLLLPETGPGAAEVALSKIRAQLDEACRAHGLPSTFSVGAVICVGAPESVDRLIRRADALMYRVKEAGGDGLRVEVLDDPFGIEAILQRS